jgi:hypothetical protein
VYRRPSGIYAVRIVVPARHRRVIGKGELHCSTRTTSLAVAKVVAHGLLAHWHEKFIRLDDLLPMDIRRILTGSPRLRANSRLPLAEAAEASGLDAGDLLRHAAAGSLSLHARLANAWGHLADKDSLTDDLEAFGRPGSPAGPLTAVTSRRNPATQSRHIPATAGAVEGRLGRPHCGSYFARWRGVC